MRLHNWKQVLIPLTLIALSVAALGDVRKPVAISEAIIAPHLQFLASDECQGRRTGEKGNEIAARYIADHFRRVGLVPVGTAKQRDPNAKMNGSGYFQPFLFVAGSEKGRDNVLQATVGSRVKKYRVGRDFEPATATASKKVEGEVVFVGWGARSSSRDDYAGADVQGKVVLALSEPEQSERPRRFRGMEFQRKVQSARDAGAAAIVIALPSDKDAPQFNGSVRPSDAGIPVVTVRRTVAAEWLAAAGKDIEEVAKGLAEKAEAFPLPVKVVVSTDVRKRELPTANIIGLLPGSDPELSKEYVVIGAHMDHLGMGGPGSLNPDGSPAVHYGADDNASGTAGVMALAEYFASLPTPPKRSLLFMAFSGEELGLLGSAHYTKNPIVPLEKTVAMLNMDMIGRMQNNRISVIGVGSSPGWNAILDEVNAHANFQMARSNSGFGGSDHQSFYRANIPVLFFFTGTHPDYHRPSDTFDKINMADMTRVVEMVAAITERVANQPDRLMFSQARTGQAETQRPRMPRASLGIMPEYSADVAGIPVGGLRSGGPAEKAGIRVGDVIVKIGEKSVRTIEEYMAALGERKPGETVQVTFRRDGNETTVTLTLAESVR